MSTANGCISRPGLFDRVPTLAGGRPIPKSLIAKLVVVAAAYYLGGRIDDLLGSTISPALFWPPNAVLLAALLLAPTNRWWAYVLAVLPADFALSHSGGASWLIGSGLFFSNTLQSLIAATCLRVFVGDKVIWDSLRPVLLFVILATIVAPALAAIPGAATIQHFHGDPLFQINWRGWFLPNALTNLTMVPLLSILLGGGWKAVTRPSWRMLECLVWFGSFLIAAVFVFEAMPASAGSFPALLYVPLPWMLWAAMRLGVAQLSAAVLSIAMVAARVAIHGRGPLVLFDPTSKVLAIQLFLFTLALPFLILTALVKERERAFWLLETRRRFGRRVAESNIIGMVLAAVDGRLLEANDAFLRIVGYSRDDLLTGRLRWDQLTPPEQLPVDVRKNADPPANGPSGTWEKEYLRKDGGRVSVLTNLAVLDEGEGTAVSFVLDISDNKKARATADESNERFRTIFYGSALPMALVDAQGRPFESNRALQEMLGYTADELSRLPFPEFTHPDDQKIDWDLYAELIAGQRDHYHIEKRFFKKDGVIVEAKLTVSLVRDASGNPAFAVGTAVDVTQQKIAERSLRESEERFRLLADEAPVMIWMSDLTKACTWFNRPWLDFAGRTMAEEAGNGWAENVHADDLSRCWTIYSDAFDARRSFQMEYRLRRADGEFRWIDDRGVPRFGPDGQFLGFVGCCSDRTEQKQAEEALGIALEDVRRSKERLQEENVYLREEADLKFHYDDIVGRGPAIKRVLVQIEQVASNTSSVLITGETGTGKELVARAIHARGPRKDRPMVKVNCAALPATLIESELFGREKGAYTGALSKQLGRFELADQSTLFLDEIGELPPEIQVKLLRTLQEGEFERLGSSVTRKCDVRIIAATNRDLNRAIQEGRFREDLFYRLNVFPIELPPLRDRPEDVTALTWTFVHEFSLKLGKTFEAIPQSTMDQLIHYRWPGNIRELRNVIERAVITSTDGHFRVELPKANGSSAGVLKDRMNEGLSLEEVQRRHIISVLERCDWRISGVGGGAELLGLKATTLESKMKRLDILRPESRRHSRYVGTPE